MNIKIAAFFAAAMLLVAGRASSPALAQSMFSGLAVDGISCDTSEGAMEHVHAHLQMFSRGHAVKVPGQVGIPGSCLYWLHTHSNDGIIHIEAPVVRTFTLGQFFDVWGEELSRTQAAGIKAAHGHVLRVTVNGKVWSGDPRSIPLRDREEIVIQNGPPFGSPHSADWTNL